MLKESNSVKEELNGEEENVERLTKERDSINLIDEEHLIIIENNIKNEKAKLEDLLKRKQEEMERVEGEVKESRRICTEKQALVDKSTEQQKLLENEELLLRQRLNLSFHTIQQYRLSYQFVCYNIEKNKYGYFVSKTITSIKQSAFIIHEIYPSKSQIGQLSVIQPPCVW